MVLMAEANSLTNIRIVGHIHKHLMLDVKSECYLLKFKLKQILHYKHLENVYI